MTAEDGTIIGAAVAAGLAAAKGLGLLAARIVPSTSSSKNGELLRRVTAMETTQTKVCLVLDRLEQLMRRNEQSMTEFGRAIIDMRTRACPAADRMGGEITNLVDKLLEAIDRRDSQHGDR